MISRWRVERCFEDDKKYVGLDHFEGRGYRPPEFIRETSQLLTRIVAEDRDVICRLLTTREPRQRVDGKRDILGLDFYDEVDGALYHLREWVDCVGTRKTPSCPAEEGVRVAAAAHLANLSYREDKIARWSDVARAGR